MQLLKQQTHHISTPGKWGPSVKRFPSRYVSVGRTPPHGQASEGPLMVCKDMPAQARYMTMPQWLQLLALRTTKIPHINAWRGRVSCEDVPTCFGHVTTHWQMQWQKGQMWIEGDADLRESPVNGKPCGWIALHSSVSNLANTNKSSPCSGPVMK